MIKHFLKKTHATLKNIIKQNQEIPAPATPAPIKKRLEVKEKIEITASAATMAKFVVLTILLLAVAGFVYQIRDILILFFVALLFAAALDPMVDALERRRVPRSIGVILIYLIVLGAVGLLVSNLVPVVAKELAQLATKIQDFVTKIVEGTVDLPGWLEWLRPTIKNFFEGLDVSKVGNYKEILLNIANSLQDVAGNVLNGVLRVFNGLFNALIVFVLTFLMTIDEHGIDKFVTSLFPSRYATYIAEKSASIKEKMGAWLRGQIALCVIVGVLVYIGFLIIGLFYSNVEYGATIALVAGFTELIPYAGPFITWIIALPVMANQSLILVVWMTVLLYVVQVLENNFIVPLVMHKAVGISPIFIMFAMFVGFSFLGVLGMILAVPVATAASLFLKDYVERDK